MTTDRFKALLLSCGFAHDLTGDRLVKQYNLHCELAADFKSQKLQWPSAVTVNDETTSNFEHPENFVVFECVMSLLDKGYRPDDIELEPRWQLGRGASGGKADIWIRRKRKNGLSESLCIIECKTAGTEFSRAWNEMQEDGGQLFSYFQQEKGTKFLCLYASDFDGTNRSRDYRLVNVQDNIDYLKTFRGRKAPPSYKNAETVRQLFRAWKETYERDYSETGLFESSVEVWHPGESVFSISDLHDVDAAVTKSMYNRFATILRRFNVSGHENAFDKLVNLILAKVVDELQNPKELAFHWKGTACDDDFRLQDRLQRLYRDGMKKFLGEEVTYVEEKQIDSAFRLFKNDPDATRETIHEFFHQLKFFTNNDFAFIDVHNERLFRQNAEVLRAIVVELLQGFRFRTDGQNQFLGDLFEGYLDQGVKQSEGQFFTPLPFVRFMVSSLPLRQLVAAHDEPLRVIDYACGAGHFLNEYAREIAHIASEEKGRDPKSDYAAIVGVEKEYRLSKVAKVAAFMYGQDDIRIVHADALATNPVLPDAGFDLLIANPPFSVKGFLKTLSEENRSRFRLSQSVSDAETNNAIETFFVERAAQLLAPGAVAAVILPSSVLTNGGIYRRARMILLESFDLVAVAEMESGSGVFGKTPTATATLFLRRKPSDPDPATQARNRAEAWGKGDFSKDGVFADADVLNDYCAIRGFDPNDYRDFLSGKTPKALFSADSVIAFRVAVLKEKKAKNIAKRRITSSYTEAMRDADLDDYVRARFLESETEKIRIWLLASANPHPVLVVRAPTKKEEIKSFLGYEWSERKDDKGIKYLGVTETDASGVSRNRDLDKISTPLFDPIQTEADIPEKINTHIRRNYLGTLGDIPESLSPFVSVTTLRTMIDFSRTDFDLALKAPTLADARLTELFAKWRKHNAVVKRMSVAAPFVRDKGVVTQKNISSYISTDTMKKDRQGVGINTQLPAAPNGTAYKSGDILVSNIRPYLKKVWFADHNGVCSNDVLVFRSANKTELLPEYLFQVISSNAFFDHMGGRGLKMPRGDKDKIETFPVPIPPIDIQKRIVGECSKLASEERGCYIESRLSGEITKKE